MDSSMRITSASPGNARIANAGVGPGTVPVVRAGLKGINKHRSCMGAISGFLSSLFMPVQENEPAHPIEMAARAPNNLQHVQKAPTEISQLPRSYQVRPRVRDGNHLGHHPGGLADEYYMTDLRRPHTTYRPITRPSKPPNTLLGNILSNECAVCEQLQKLQASSSSYSTSVSGPGVGLCTSKSMVLSPFGRQKILCEVACPPPKVSGFPRLGAASKDWIIGSSMTTSLLPLSEDLYDNWCEDTTYQLNGIGIPRTQLISRRTILSVGSEDYHSETRGIPLARPASHRRALSDCSSEGLRENDSETDDIPMTLPGNHPRALSEYFSVGLDSDNENEDVTNLAIAFLQTDSSSSISSDDSTNSSSTTQSVEPVDLFPSQERGAQRFPAFVEATTCRSLTADFCYASEEEEHEREENSAPKHWHSGRRRPNLTIHIPRIDSVYEISQRIESDIVIDAFEPELTDQDTHRGQNSAARFDRGGFSISEDPGWLEPYQEMSDLLFAGEDQACLARFVHLWDDEYAKPVDQCLFADFSTDFTTVPTTLVC
jgi:hypothetical protein